MDLVIRFNLIMDLRNQSCAPVLPVIFRGENFDIWHYAETFQSKFWGPYHA